MKKQTRSPKSITKHSARLGAYLAAGIGAAAATAPTADAAIVLIDIGPGGFNIGGINAGLANGTDTTRNNFPTLGEGQLQIRDNFGGIIGMAGYDGLGFAYNGVRAAPVNFALNSPIDGNSSFGSWFGYTAFRYIDYTNIDSPDFGPGSYMGFRTNSGNYGWLEVTWTAKTSQFQILSGAYEDVAGVTILAGDTGGSAAVPEPSTWAMSALLAGGVAFTVWRKRRQKALKEAA